MDTRRLTVALGRWFIRTKVKASDPTLIAAKWRHWKEHGLVAADVLLHTQALPGRVNNPLCFYICESLHLVLNLSAFAFTPLPVGSLVLRCPLPFIPCSLSWHTIASGLEAFLLHWGPTSYNHSCSPFEQGTHWKAKVQHILEKYIQTEWVCTLIKEEVLFLHIWGIHMDGHPHNDSQSHEGSSVARIQRLLK